MATAFVFFRVLPWIPWLRFLVFKNKKAGAMPRLFLLAKEKPYSFSAFSAR